MGEESSTPGFRGKKFISANYHTENNFQIYFSEILLILNLGTTGTPPTAESTVRSCLGTNG